MNPRKPIDNQIPDQKNNERSSDYLPNHRPLAHRFPFFHAKRKRIANRKQKGWKYQVRGRKTMPPGMLKLRKSNIIADLRIHDDHKADRHSTENVKGQRTIA
jgi:hypothetical protein